MKERLRHCWAWLADENNRGRVIAIAAVVGVIITAVGLSIKNGTDPTPPPPGGEVRLSVEDFQAVLEKREREVEQRLAQAHGDERSLLENELTEVKRQLSDIETAHAAALRVGWTWLADENNRGRVITIAAVVGVIITALGIIIRNRTVTSPPPSGGEVRLSVEDFQAVLEKRAREVEQRLAQAHGEERHPLENELTEVKRQLADIEPAYAAALKRSSEFEIAGEYTQQRFIPGSEKYTSPATTGRVTFDYSNNNGKYSIGSDAYMFETQWSKASDQRIHVYNDPPSIRTVALVKDKQEISSIDDASIYDGSSRARSPSVGQIVLIQNTNGFFAALKVLNIKDDTRGSQFDELTFEYVIQTNETPDFTKFSQSE